MDRYRDKTRGYFAGESDFPKFLTSYIPFGDLLDECSKALSAPQNTSDFKNFKIVTTEKDINIRIDIPGVPREAVAIEYVDGRFDVKISHKDEIFGDVGKEISLYPKITIPDIAKYDIDGTEVIVKDGQLIFRIPRKEVTKRQIEIKPG